jgi:hypothetical protein
MLQVLHVSESESHGGTALALGEGARRAKGQRMWCVARLGSYGRGVLVLISAPRSRLCGERGGVGEGAASVGQGEMDEEGLQRYSGSAACFCRAVRYRPMKSYPLEVWVPTILKTFSPRVLGIESFMIALLKENKIE